MTNGPFRIRRILVAAGLTLVWCALWRSISVANVASGVVVSAVAVGTGVGTPATGGVRIVPLARFAWLVMVDLVRSTIDVAVEIVTPTDRTEEGIVAVPVPAPTRHHLLLLIVAITVTPGTAVVDADPDTGTLYLHLLHIDRRAATVAHVEALARLACDALPLETAGAAS